MPELFDFDRGEFACDLGDSLGAESFRADQVFRWIGRAAIDDFELMSDISKPLRIRLAARYSLSVPKVRERSNSSDGSVRFLLALSDASLVECVFIVQPKRNTLCISSQVGCGFGCEFCRTGALGFSRNLRSHEIVGQVLAVRRALAKEYPTEKGESPFSNVVFMGMGEPLDNLNSVLRALRILNDDLCFGFSSRRLTISTAGHVPGIRKLSKSPPRANLAVSLNATTDEVRNRLMPINRRWGLDDLFSSLRDYPLRPRQRITIEYVLMHGINDSKSDLRRLVELVHGLPVKINLIPLNPHEKSALVAPTRKEILSWHSELLSGGLTATVRWSKGADISAACGQLGQSRRNRGK